MSEQNNFSYELKINVAESEKPWLAEVLNELDVECFVYGAIECDLDAEYTEIKAQHDYFEEHGKNTPILIYSDNKDYLDSIKDALTHILTQMQKHISKDFFEMRRIENKDWQESWKATFKPVTIGHVLAILPPWENQNSYLQTHKIIIDPGMAFGTGQHETTKLCLQNLIDHLEKIENKKEVSLLDVGTGSGILAIAAKKLGVQNVVGIDIDPICLPIAEENAKNNAVHGIQFMHSAVHALKVHSAKFGVVIANIQSTPLKSLIPDMKTRMAPDGVLILSGILVSEIPEFTEFLTSEKIIVRSTHKQNDWCSIVCQK